MLYVVGLGLSDEKDVTVKGLEVGVPDAILLLGLTCAPHRPSSDVNVSTWRLTLASSWCPKRGW